jgi:hypothetical protein
VPSVSPRRSPVRGGIAPRTAALASPALAQLGFRVGQHPLLLV